MLFGERGLIFSDNFIYLRHYNYPKFQFLNKRGSKNLKEIAMNEIYVLNFQ